MNLITILSLALTLTQVTPSFIAPILSEQIGGSIFHENQLYMIYVCDWPDVKMEPVFNQYCQEQGRLCAILSPEVEQFADFKAFIGETADQFFVIIDAQRRKKYVLPIVQGMTANDLRIFQSKFEQGNLSPFYASEQPDPQPYAKCQRVVGKSLDKFLSGPSELKVLFLYTQHSACQVCGQMLRHYADMAEKLYDREIVSFGYFDIFKNDHPRITDQILPYFLIFSKEREEPYGLQGDKFHQLEETIIQIALKDTDIDLDKFRREHTLNLANQKPTQEYELNYKIKKDQRNDQDQEQL